MARLGFSWWLAAVLLTSIGARAQVGPGFDVDLVIEKGFFSYPQTNGKWAEFSVGPNRTALADRNVSIGNCGCFLSTLGSIEQFYLGGSSLPYFAYIERYTGQAVMNFAPRYLDMFLMFGSGVGTQPSAAWGYKPLPSGTCGTAPRPWALQSSARSSEVVDPVSGKVLMRSPSGIRWGTYRILDLGFDKIDQNLKDGRPTIVVVNVPLPSGAQGLHAQLVVGYDAVKNNYKIIDPGWPTFMDSARPGSGDELSYTTWLQSVDRIIDVVPVTEPLSQQLIDSIAVIDDPGPIELLAIAPDGRRTGFDPALGRHVREVESVELNELGAWTTPMGAVTPTEPARFLEVRDPVDGTWRFQVTGTGNGMVPLTLATVRRGQETALLDVTRPVTAGSALKFEVVYRRNGQRTAAEVSNFTPTAAFSGPARGRTDEPAAFDGRASFDVDGTISTWRWEFGDGATANGAQVTHAWTQAGVYPVKLTVTDASGATGSAIRQIIVTGMMTPSGWVTERVNTSDAGIAAQGPTDEPAISADGRFVAFSSSASNLVANDTNGVPDVFVKDLATGAIERVSISSAGAQGVPGTLRTGSRLPSLSADGRFVAFTSSAINLVANDANGEERDVFVHDRVTHTTELVSVSSAGVQGDLRSGKAIISATGRFVAFESAASNLVPGGNGADHVYLRDRMARTTELVSAAADGTPGANVSGVGGVSADGRFVVFDSRARNLVAVDIGLNWQVFLRDRQAGTVELVGLDESGYKVNAHVYRSSMSTDGRFVAFESTAPMVAADGNGRPDIFVRDRMAATTTRVSVSTFGVEGDAQSLYPAISPDGRWVAFHSTSSNLVADDTNRTGPLPAGADVFLHDRQTGITARASVATDGAEALPDGSLAPFAAVALEGAVVFNSLATNLVPGDTNMLNDIFVHRRPKVLPVADPSGPYAGWASGATALAHVSFDARRSFDPVGAALTARWDFGDGSPVVETSAATPVDHAYAAAGNFVVTLVVKASGRESAPVTTTADIRAPRAATVARTAAIPSCGKPGATIRLSSRGEPLMSPTGGWDFGAGPPPSTAAAHPEVMLPVTLAGAAARQLMGSVEAVEIEGGIEVTTVVTVELPGDLSPGAYTVSVSGAAPTPFAVPCPVEPPRPRARAGGPYQGNVGKAVAFDGSGSTAAQAGAMLEYTWDFGDGETGTGVRPQHVYAAVGTYLVTLVVKEGTLFSIPVMGGGSFAQAVIEPAVPAVPEEPQAVSKRCGCGGGEAGSLALVLAALTLGFKRRARAARRGSTAADGRHPFG